MVNTNETEEIIIQSTNDLVEVEDDLEDLNSDDDLEDLNIDEEADSETSEGTDGRLNTTETIHSAETNTEKLIESTTDEEKVSKSEKSENYFLTLINSFSFRSALLYGVFRLLLQFDLLTVVIIVFLGNLTYWFFKTKPTVFSGKDYSVDIAEAKGIIVELPVAASLLFLENQDLHMDITINDATNTLQVYVE